MHVPFRRELLTVTEKKKKKPLPNTIDDYAT